MERFDQKLPLLAEIHDVALTKTARKIKMKPFFMVAAFYLNIHVICVNGSHLVFTYQHQRAICKPCLHLAVEIVSSFLQSL